MEREGHGFHESMNESMACMEGNGKRETGNGKA